MRKGQSPLVGYNTNLHHKGKTFHVQTEDSGINHPHIITHIFADGGRIVGSRKTDYSEYVNLENLEEIVRKLMKDQHKELLIGLRDGIYEETGRPAAGGAAGAGARKTPGIDIEALDKAAEARIGKSAISRVRKAPEREALDKAAEARVHKIAANRTRKTPDVDIEALDKAAEARIGKSAFSSATPRSRKSGPPQKKSPETRSSRPRQISIFGSDASNEKSLDDVILSYLTEDAGEK